MSKGEFERQPMGFLEWLTILFIGLKLTGHIEWSLWVVLSPVYVYVIFFIIDWIKLKESE